MKSYLELVSSNDELNNFCNTYGRWNSVTVRNIQVGDGGMNYETRNTSTCR